MTKLPPTMALMLELTHQENLIMTPKIYVRFFDDLLTAVIFVYIKKQIDKSPDKTVKIMKIDWLDNLGIPYKKVESRIDKLKAKNIIKTKEAKGKITEYKLNLLLFTKLLVDFMETNMSDMIDFSDSNLDVMP